MYRMHVKNTNQKLLLNPGFKFGKMQELHNTKFHTSQTRQL